MNKRNRALCGVWVDQIMSSLLHIGFMPTEKSAKIMYRVDWFPRDDDNVHDSERLSLQAVEINAEILSDDHLSTLTTIERRSGEDGGCLLDPRGGTGEEAADPGGRHPDTLTTMNNPRRRS